MTNAQKYLDAVKAHYGGISDYRAAKILEVTKYAVRRWRNGQDSFSPTTAKKVAEELGIDEEIVVIESQLDRCKTPEETAIWQRVLKRLSNGTAAAILLIIMSLAPTHSEAATPTQTALAPLQSGNVFYYVKLLKAWFRGLLPQFSRYWKRRAIFSSFTLLPRYSSCLLNCAKG